MENPRIIGHIVSVQGFRVKVEILPETRSASRATLDGIQKAVAINAYLTFSIGAGQVVIGIITDLESRETYDPTTGDELSLELLKPRRIANVQLLGTIEQKLGGWLFNPGITILPTLDTAAEISAPDTLKAVFETPPRRNKPEDYDGEDYDCNLCLGHPTGQPSGTVNASYNDLFSRPLAIVGNTGSGKSFSVSSLIQKAMRALGEAGNEPHVFVLDINGEYGRAFVKDHNEHDRKPDYIYLNGLPFGVPIWLFNAQEICSWLSASEQTQEPVLKDWWAIAKASGAESSEIRGNNLLRHALNKANIIIQTLDAPKAPYLQTCCRQFQIIKSYIGTAVFDGYSELRELLKPHAGQLKPDAKVDWQSPEKEAEIRKATQTLIESIRKSLASDTSRAAVTATTADSPRYVPRSKLIDPVLLDQATSAEDIGKIEGHLTTLKLRLQTRMYDPRWRSFLNYEDEETRISSVTEWFESFGLGITEGPRVSIIDLSMLSHEVLPYACTVIGRILLEARENLQAARRYKHPWVFILEEAHNYARPPRANEERGQTLSRLGFERIAKEGRKFGLSLVIASQRPSEISQTIISQCANFISHRLQNPDDIDHFRHIIPIQARRLLDQVTILASGEAIVFGSAFHVPTRVQFDPPKPKPYSQTAAPYFEWKNETQAFPLTDVIHSWGLETMSAIALSPEPNNPLKEVSKNDEDFDF
jgi:DNA helicase HerA-like ATPase